MNRAIAWMAGNPVAANLAAIFVLAAGLVVAPTLRQEIFPEIKMGMIAITTVHPGASPDEVEESINVRIEEEIYSLEGVKRVTGTAREGLSTVAAEVEFGADARALLDDIKARVDAIDTLPAEAERPVVTELESFRNVIDVAVYGDVEERALREVAERVRDELSALPVVSRAELMGARPYEISIEVEESALRRHGLSFDSVLAAVRRSSLDLPGGSLESDGGEILLRTDAQARRGRDFQSLVLLTREDGTRLRVGDVANVVDGFADTRQGARFEGRPAVLVQVLRTGDDRVLDVVEAVERYVRASQREMPPGISLATWRDESVQLESRRDLMLENGAYGLALVFLTLGLFLKLRTALWVAFGIPVSFLGALAVLPPLDVSINTVSLVGFIVALGLVVDDAIVVAESVAREDEAEAGRVRAAVRGAQAVAVPVIVAALTTIVMMAPALALGGIGQQGRPVPIVVIACLAFSLLEALFVLPAHLAHARATGAVVSRAGLDRVARTWDRAQGRCAAGLEAFAERVYRPALLASLRGAGIAAAAGFAAIALSIGLVAGGWLPFTFLPDAEGDYVTAVLTMPEGTPDRTMDALVARLEASANALRGELDSPPPRGAGGDARERSVVRRVFTAVGSQPEKRRQSFFQPLTWNTYEASHLLEVQLELVPRAERSLSTAEIADRWRELLGEIPDAVELSFPISIFSTGDPIDVQLAGADGDVLRHAAAELETALGRYPGVHDVRDSARDGKRELHLRIRPEAEATGLSTADLARQIRQGFYGEEAQRVRRGREDVPVVVRYPKTERRSLTDLDGVRIRTREGRELPFAAVATAEWARGHALVQRADRKRTLRITAEVDPHGTNANQVVSALESDVLPRLLADHPGVSYTLEGHQREQAEFLETLARGSALGLLAVFALIAIPLRSYAQPLLILVAVPFGFVGAVLGHALFGMDMTMFTLIGVVGVAGVVVNDALVLLHAIRGLRERGLAPRDAVVRGCLGRFRPVVLTTLTTSIGLAPLLLERSTYAQELKPMAISLAFGELASTCAVLLVLPAMYVLFAELRAERARGPASPLRGAPLRV